MLEQMPDTERLAFVVALCNGRFSPLSIDLQVTDTELNAAESRDQLQKGRRRTSFGYLESYDNAA